MKAAFFGTPQLAAPCLEALIEDSDIEVSHVFTQPDRKVGRKQTIAAPPIKQIAQQHNIEVLQPENKKELKEATGNLDVDFFVVMAYGMIMPNSVLEIPKIAPINVHVSLLPKYRGASPVQSALLNGDKETGITIMHIEEKMDAGKIYFQHRLKIEEDDYLQDVNQKLAKLTAKHIAEDLKKIATGAESRAQDESLATHCKKIEKADGEIDFTKTSQEIINQIRAFDPWPGSFTHFQGKKLKILSATSSQQEPEGFSFKTGDGYLIPQNLQMEGKKAMNIEQFSNGYLR